jgi:hypothetical protein
LADDSWLELPQVSPGKKLTGERKRAPSMAKAPFGKNRVWACDGTHVFFRRKKSNPETLKRHEDFIRRDHYVHVETQDDVEIYKLQPASPFKRPQRDLTALDVYNLRRETVLAACRREWATFIDGLTELSTRIKSRYHDAFAVTVYQENLQAVFLAINMRGGPSQQEIDREVRALRQRRGDNVSRLIVLPAGMKV